MGLKNLGVIEASSNFVVLGLSSQLRGPAVAWSDYRDGYLFLSRSNYQNPAEGLKI